MSGSRTRLLIQGGDFRAYGRQALALPVTRGVVQCFFPASASDAVRNRVAGGNNGAIAGTLTYGAGYMVSSNQNNRIDTDSPETLASTLYVVARSGAAFSSTTTRPQFIGTYKSQSSGIAGTSILVTGTPSTAPAATVALGAARDNAGTPTFSTASITVADMSAWTMLVGVVLDGATTNARQIYDYTNDVSAVATPATGRTLSTSLNIRVGNLSSITYGTCDIACGIVANVAHTEAERDAMVAAIRRRLLAFHSIAC
jgi:hypothetical protein